MTSHKKFPKNYDYQQNACVTEGVNLGIFLWHQILVKTWEKFFRFPFFGRIEFSAELRTYEEYPHFFLHFATDKK